MRPQTRGPLRVATFNVGLMSTFVRNWDRRKDYIGAVKEGLENLFMTDREAVASGKAIARRLLEAPYDIVVLQEVFHADSRDAIVAALTDPSLPGGARYPWVIDRFGAEERMPKGHPHPALHHYFPALGPFGDLPGDLQGILHSLLDDSGLMVASRLPFIPVPLPDGNTEWAFSRFTAAEGIDALAPKGVAAVAVEPFEGWPVVVTFTHMQADEGKDDVRRHQMDQVVWLTRGVASAVRTEHAILMGDLNIRGELSEAGLYAGEYVDAFGPTSALHEIALDGWREAACGPLGYVFPLVVALPPKGEFDACLTHRDDKQRLDYVVPLCLRGRVDVRSGRELAAQHLSIANELHDGIVAATTPIGLAPQDLAAPRGHSALSDHYGVSAVIGTNTQSSSPAVAQPCTPPWPVGGEESQEFASFKGVRHGEMRWLVVEPGAYRIYVPDSYGSPPEVDLQVFAPHDFSRSLMDVMPHEPSGTDIRSGRRYPAVNHRMLVRMHRLDPQKDWLSATVRRMIGATPGDAVGLRPWTPTPAMPWPRQHLNGGPLPRWFEVVLDAPVPGISQTLNFVARSGTGAPAAVTFDVFEGTSTDTPEAHLSSPSATLVTSADGATEDHSLHVDDVADARFLVRMSPMDGYYSPTVAVEVRSDILFIEGISFIAHDETGLDWLGSDTIRWRVRSDHPAVPERSGTTGSVNTNPHRQHPMVSDVLPFSGSVTAVLTELGDVDRNHSAIFPLVPTEPPGTPHEVRKILQDALKPGIYGVSYTWRRVLQG